MNTANLTGIQHIGLPTKDLEATIRFYESLGFQVANRSETPDGGPVVKLHFPFQNKKHFLPKK